jgi:acyl-coenzyme A thioesterase PaaI-like protein
MISGIDDMLPDPEAPRVRLGRAVRRLSQLVVTREIDEVTASRVADEVDAITQELVHHPERPPGAGQELDVLRRQAGLFNPVIGWANPIAPPMRVSLGNDGTATVTGQLDRRVEGPPGCVHGGWVAALLDQTLGHANAAVGLGAYTVELVIRYHKPTPYDVPLVVVAGTESQEGHRILSRGELRAGGEITASAEGRFVEWGGF